MKRTIAMVLGGALVATALLTFGFALNFREAFYNHFVVAPGVQSTNSVLNYASTNIFEVRGVNGTNAIEWTTNVSTLTLTNAANASNGYAFSKPVLDFRLRMRFGTSYLYAVTNATLVSSNPVLGKWQTNIIVNGIMMDARGEAY